MMSAARVPLKIELAWAAGFFDSSGSILFSAGTGKKSRYSHLVVSLIAKDEVTIEVFVRLFGGSVYRRGRPKPVLRWRASTKNAERFLQTIVPYLRRKREAARLALFSRELIAEVGAKNLGAGVLKRRRILEGAVKKLEHGRRIG
jgi:hypothetical protein